MAKVLITESYLEDIGDAIRAKLESEDTYKPSEMADAIMQISGGGGETKNIWGGTTEPETIQGVNGDIYIKYTDYRNLLPSEYTALNYIGVDSTAGAYINTGVEQKATSYFELEMQYTANPSNDTWAFGTLYGTSANEIGFYSNKIYFYINNSGSETAFDTAKHTYLWNAEGSFIDGTKVNTRTSVDRPTYYYTLFARGDVNGAANSPTSNCRIYHCKIYDDDVVVRDLYPCFRNSDDELGMYDIINDVFYTNAGTNSFIGGTALEGTPIDAAYLKVNGTWIILENGDWDNVNAEGSDNVVWVETASPTQAQGIIGDIWIKYMDASVITTRSYTLNIIDGLRGSAVLHYVGAHEIELIYDDGEGNEVNIRTLPNFTHSCNCQSANAAFDGNTSGTYWEANPTPVVVEFSATVPSTYTLKKFVVWQRNTSGYTHDVWSDFELSETVVGTTRTLLTEYGLTESDWAGAGYGTEWDLSNIPNLRYIITNTYAKIGDSEESAEWTETPIEVTIGGGGGSTSIVLLDEEQTQSSGGSISIDETVTISEARDYYIIAYGFCNYVNVYINDVLQTNNLDSSGNYYHAYSQKKTLNVGDIVRVDISSSGQSDLRAFIAAL